MANKHNILSANTKIKRPASSRLISGGDTGTVNPHPRHVGAMGPIRYVRLKQRIRLFSPTDAPNPEPND